MSDRRRPRLSTIEVGTTVNYGRNFTLEGAPRVVLPTMVLRERQSAKRLCNLCLKDGVFFLERIATEPFYLHLIHFLHHLRADEAVHHAVYRSFIRHIYPHIMIGYSVHVHRQYM